MLITSKLISKITKIIRVKVSILFSITLVKYNEIKSLFFFYITLHCMSEYYIIIDLELRILYSIYYDITPGE